MSAPASCVAPFTSYVGLALSKLNENLAETCADPTGGARELIPDADLLALNERQRAAAASV